MRDEHRRAFERKLVHHCTPTLAGLKPANLFTCPPEALAQAAAADGGGTDGAGGAAAATASPTPEELFRDALRAAREKLAPQGVRIEVLARRSTGRLLYVYRPQMVKEQIGEPRAAAFLAAEGYDTASLSACIMRLHRRICGTDLHSTLSGGCSFPHEIGLFLGYPYEDVIGFIENKGENFLCCGCWKVYSRERDAQDCFCRYKNCTALFEELYDGGAGIEELAAVAEDGPAAAALAASLEELQRAV